MSIENRIQKLEEKVRSQDEPPFLIVFSHEEAQRIKEAYEKAGRRLNSKIIIIHYDSEAEH